VGRANVQIRHREGILVVRVTVLSQATGVNAWHIWLLLAATVSIIVDVTSRVSIRRWRTNNKLA
jgi:hypothetical protein